jgi:riboflavin kinase/FMN adenylyltransferase
MATMKNYSISKNKSEITSIAIGGFDGMHKAHQELFNNLDSNGAVLVIDSGYATLTPKSSRQEFTKNPVYFYILNEIKHLNGEDFIKLLMSDFPNLEKIVVGYDFCFGTNRKYCIRDLKNLFTKKVKIIDEVSINGISVHSRVIREYLKNGDIKTSNLLLGKNYKIKGSQIKGQGLGSKSFVPTINLKVNDYLLPNEGVYVTKTLIDSKEYKSITFLGHRVTTDNTYAVETHLIDETIKNPSNDIEILFIDKLRNNKKFNSFDALKEQILLDINRCKTFFTPIKSL